jgi:hypothetical protein
MFGALEAALSRPRDPEHSQVGFRRAEKLPDMVFWKGVPVDSTVQIKFVKPHSPRAKDYAWIICVHYVMSS